MVALIAATFSAAQDGPPAAPPRIDWRRVEEQDRRGTKKDKHTAAELLDVYLEALVQEDMDSARALEGLIARKPDADVLSVAAKLLDNGMDIATRAAGTLAQGVLGKEPRTVTVEQCAALEEVAAKILAREILTPEADLMGADDTKRRAAQVLAALGTPRATEALIKLVRGRSPYALALRDTRQGDVPQLALALLELRADHFDATPVAEALGGSAEGRAELRRLLDPKSPYGWQEHGPAKGAAFAALTNKFQDLDDLVAIESALQQVDMIDPSNTMLPYSKKTPEQAEAIVQFLAEHEGARIEDALFLAVALLPPTLKEELVLKLDVARPGAWARVEAKRRAWEEQRAGASGR